jgi:surface protein
MRLGFGLGLKYSKLSGGGNTDAFIIEVKTDNAGTSNDNQFQFTGALGDYDVIAKQNGTQVATFNDLSGQETITLPSSGVYDLEVMPKASNGFNRIAFGDDGDKLKITDIKQWGEVVWSSFERAFFGCSNMLTTATDVPNLSNVNNMFAMFTNATSANPDTTNWDVSNVTNMYFMFESATVANPNTTNWDVSNVTNMRLMFSDASSANPDTSNWDVSSVINMSLMFYNTSSANPDVSNWDVSSVTEMYAMFREATSANPDTSNWDVSNVTDMSNMFRDASSANPDTSNWNVSSVTDMSSMFRDASSANPVTTDWDVGSVTDMGAMFRYAGSANPDVSNWDVSNVTDINRMFFDASLANPNTSNWNVSNVTNMSLMFRSATSANPDVSNWDVSNVTNMRQMFLTASSANPDVSNWDVSSVTNMKRMFEGSALSEENLTAIYENWSQLNLQQNVSFSAGNTKYNASGQAGRDILVNTYNWTITDGGLVYQPFIIEVDTSKTGVSNNNQFQFTGAQGDYDVVAKQNDIIVATFDDLSNQETITLPSSGIYVLEVIPKEVNGFNRINFDQSGDRFKITDIKQWGTIVWSSFRTSFFGCYTMKVTATDAPNLSLCTSFHRMFRYTSEANPDVTNWDVSNIENFSQMFLQAFNANPDTSNWDVSNATNMAKMFKDSNLSVENLTACYENWSQLTLQQNVSFGAGNTKYNASGQAGRDILVNTYNWTITDGGQV